MPLSLSLFLTVSHDTVVNAAYCDYVYGTFSWKEMQLMEIFLNGRRSSESFLTHKTIWQWIACHSCREEQITLRDPTHWNFRVNQALIADSLAFHLHPTQHNSTMLGHWRLSKCAFAHLACSGIRPTECICIALMDPLSSIAAFRAHGVWCRPCWSDVSLDYVAVDSGAMSSSVYTLACWCMSSNKECICWRLWSRVVALRL
jgi:hypothetical protein